MSSCTRILLTGATGFLGGAVASELLNSATWPDVLLLVRAASPDEGVARIRANLSRFAVTQADLVKICPEQIICGDVTAVDQFAHDERLQGVTHVLNCAAVTSFGSHPKIWETNVTGTLAFARRMGQRASMRRFVQVGTAMICGENPGRLVQEDDYPSSDVQHLVEYTASKAAAEVRLREEMSAEILLVVRPSIIAGHSRLGCRASHSIFWAFRMSDAMRRITCDIDSVIDVIPVDYVARALIHLLTLPSLRYSTYHIAAGSDRCCSFREIGTSFSRALGEQRSAPYQTVTYEDLRAMQNQFQGFFGRCNRRFMLQAMKLYGKFAALNTCFDTSRLLAEGFPKAPRFTEYLHTCVETSRDRTIAEQMLIDFQ